MSIAAVPRYLGQDFSTASPGLRFGMLLPIWTNRADQEREVNERARAKSEEGREVQALLKQGMDAAIKALCQRKTKPLPRLWEKNDFGARAAWAKITALGDADRLRMRALAARQDALADTTINLLRLDAFAIAPFTTGLGNEHPLENGFAFLNPYGLPYLPGSGVKGVLRQAARELASGEWGDAHGWSTDPCYPLMQGDGEKRHQMLRDNKQPVMLSMLDVLFGRESEDGNTEHVRGALGFWDVIPQIAGNSLKVEIMTPHQSHYYQNGDNPHDSGQPNPIHFLTVPPGSGFAFHVVCDTRHLALLAPALAADDRWKTLLGAAYEHAFAWLGFGAKTAVGYGAMQHDEDKEKTRQTQREQAQRAADRATLSAAMRAIQDFIEYMQNRRTQLRGNLTRTNGDEHNRARQLAKTAIDAADWTPAEKAAAANAIIEWLPKVVQVDMKDESKKLKLRQLLGES